MSTEVARPPLPPAEAWRPLVDLALEEDFGSGDVTTPLVLGADAQLAARIEARQEAIVCGLPLARFVFQRVDAALEVVFECEEADRLGPGSIVLGVSGAARAILAAERTVLNFLGRTCGVATFTRRFVEAVAGTGVQIIDTRKTVPGWRVLDKYATAIGGAVNHRLGLHDGILLKDNHIAAGGGVSAVVKAARERAPSHLRVQVEVESEAQAAEAVAAGAESLLLDNLPLETLRLLARRFRDRIELEASGGVTLANVREVADTGVHRISIGALTHSAPAADLSLELSRAGAEGAST